MNQEQINKGNKLIAEFMDDYKTDAKGRKFYMNQYDPDNFEFNTDWNWLMPVVEKIRGTWEGSFCRVMDFDIDSTTWNGKKTSVRISIMLLKSGNPYHTIKVTNVNMLEAIYTAVISFLEWKEKEG